jgi:hypothetical protein
LPKLGEQMSAEAQARRAWGTFNSELEREIKSYIENARKMEEHDTIVGNLGIIVTQAPALPSANPELRSVTPTPKIGGSGPKMGRIHLPRERR